jgi:hypothetical protein
MCPRSNNWRINKSSLMAVEGAQALKALTKVAGAAGLPKDFKVKFATENIGSGIDLDDRELTIGGAKLFKEAPIPADNFDVLVGLTLHEVGHYSVGTREVWTTLLRTYYQNVDPLLQKFVNIGEDIVIESKLAANSALVDYGDALFNWATSQCKREANTNKLLELWIEFGLLHKSDKLFDLPQEMVDAMTQLVAFTAWLRHSHNCTDRAAAYNQYWNALKDLIKNPPVIEQPQPEKDILGQNEDGTNEKSDEKPDNGEEGNKDEWNDWGDSEQDKGGDSEPTNTDEDTEDGEPGNSDSEDEEEAGEEDEMEEEEPADEGDMETPLGYASKSGDRIDENLAEAIEDAIQSDSEDITDKVLEEFGQQSGKFEASCPIIRKRETQTPLIQPDQNLCKKLGRITTIRKRLQARIMHGEQYGRIDKRHLHRVVTDKRIFNLKYKFPDGFPNTKILLDLSGSMSGRQAEEVLQAAGALQVLVNAEVWCYDKTDTVNLTRMDEGKMVHKYNPNGTTPSGLAIAGVAIGMKRGGLVIHLTDGGHNYGQQPWNANWVLKEHGIELVNLIWGNDAKSYDYDGMNFRKLKSLADFPDALYEILVKQAKLGNIGG